MFSVSSNPMRLDVTLTDQAGSEKFKMAASKTAMCPPSSDKDAIQTYQAVSLYFDVSAASVDRSPVLY